MRDVIGRVHSVRTLPTCTNLSEVRYGVRNGRPVHHLQESGSGSGSGRRGCPNWSGAVYGQAASLDSWAYRTAFLRLSEAVPRCRRAAEGQGSYPPPGPTTATGAG